MSLSYLTISAGASRSGITVTSDCKCTVYGNLSDSTVAEGGSVFVSAVTSNGVTYYGTIDNLTIYGNLGTTGISQYQQVKNIYLGYGGSISGWSASTYFVSIGSSPAYIQYVGYDTVVSGNVKNLHFNGRLYTSGAALQDVITGDDGRLYLRLGSIAYNTTVKGDMYAEAGTKSFDTWVVSGGNFTVASGAYVSGLNIANALVSASAGAELTGAIQVSSGGKLVLHNNVIQGNLSISGTSASVSAYDGAVISQAQVSSGAVLTGNGYKAYDIQIYSGGFHGLSTSDYASGTVIHAGGSQNVYGSAVRTEVNGGHQYVIDDGYSEDAVVRNNGTQTLYYGASAVRTHISSGGIQIASGNYGGYVWDTIVSLGGVQSIIGTPSLAQNTVVYGSQVAIGGAKVSSSTVYGKQILSSGASAYDTYLQNGAVADVSSGAYANRMHVSNGGKVNAEAGAVLTNLHISNGGEVNNATIYAGRIATIYSGGALNSATVASDGRLNVQGGGSAVDVTLNNYSYLSAVVNKDTFISGTSNGSAMVISSGQLADWEIKSSNYFQFASDAVVSNIYVRKYGSAVINGSGTNIHTDYQGTLHITSGGYVNGGSIRGIVVVEDATIENMSRTYTYGGLNINSGGVAKNLVISAGTTWVRDNGVINSVTASAGNINVSSGGTIINANISGGKLDVSSGGIVSNVNIFSGGGLYVSSGGVAFNAVLQRNASFSIANGGFLVDAVIGSGVGINIRGSQLCGITEICSGATLHLYSGGVVSGLDIASGGVVSAYAGGLINFDLTERTTAHAALVNNLKLVKGAPTYTITVAAAQANGVYQLAAGAAGFNGSITIGDGSETYGTLALDSTFKYNGKSYTLNNTDGNLTLAVNSYTQFFTGNFSGAADMLLGSKDGKVSIYANNAVWSEMTLEDGWNVVGVADFNGDGKADILRKHVSGLVIGEMSDGLGSFTPQVLNSVGSGWGIEGTGDFNGDGVGDVLIANPTAASDGNPDYPADQPPIGLLGYWKGGTEWTLINGYSPEWEMIATGDFNNDGKSDMLWRNEFIGAGGATYNAYCTWIVDNANDWRMVSVANPDEWDFLCSGDFNADGCNDIAMINGAGVVGIWGVSDGYMNSWSILSAVDTATWELAGVGDFNGDGTDDIAWCNTESGLTGYWQITNKTLASWQNIATVA